jgi:hypothetical protein
MRQRTSKAAPCTSNLTVGGTGFQFDIDFYTPLHVLLHVYYFFSLPGDVCVRLQIMYRRLLLGTCWQYPGRTEVVIFYVFDLESQKKSDLGIFRSKSDTPVFLFVVGIFALSRTNEKAASFSKCFAVDCRKIEAS